MALTYEQALAEAKRQQQGAGAVGAIDPNYVKTLMTGQDAGYTQGILDANKKQPTIGTVAAVDPQKQLADTIKNRKLSALEQAYQRNLGSLEAEKTAIDPAFASQTRQAVTQADMGKKSFADFLAEKGLSSSGLAGQGEISQNIALQGQLGGIETQRSNALADIERRRTGLGQDLAYGQQQTEMDIAQQELENQIAREQAAQQAQFESQSMQEERAYKEQLAQADREWERQKAILDAEIKQALAEQDYEYARLLNAQKAQIDAKKASTKSSTKTSTGANSLGLFSQGWGAQQ